MIESFRNEGAGLKEACRLLGKLGLTLSDMRRYRIANILVFYCYKTNDHKLGGLFYNSIGQNLSMT